MEPAGFQVAGPSEAALSPSNEEPRLTALHESVAADGSPRSFSLVSLS